MASALKASGSTRAWRRLRAHWQRKLEREGWWTCRRCGNIVLPTEDWHLGHPDDATRVEGGEDDDVEPEHAECSVRANRRAGRVGPSAGRVELGPSRDW